LSSVQTFRKGKENILKLTVILISMLLEKIKSKMKLKLEKQGRICYW
jgi:hypothetical protein